MNKKTLLSLFFLTSLVFSACDGTLSSFALPFKIVDYSPNQILTTTEPMPKFFSFTFTKKPKIMPQYFNVYSSENRELPIEGKLSVKNKTLFFHPTQPFNTTYQYEVKIHPAYESIEGNELDSTSSEFLCWTLPHRTEANQIIEKITPLKDENGIIHLNQHKFSNICSILFTRTILDASKLPQYIQIEEEHHNKISFLANTDNLSLKKVNISLFSKGETSYSKGKIIIRKEITEILSKDFGNPLKLSTDIIIPFDFTTTNNTSHIDYFYFDLNYEKRKYLLNQHNVELEYCPQYFAFVPKTPSIAFNDAVLKLKIEGCQLEPIPERKEFKIIPPFNKNKLIKINDTLKWQDKDGIDREEKIDITIHYQKTKLPITNLYLAHLIDGQITEAIELSENCDLNGFTLGQECYFIFEFETTRQGEIRREELFNKVYIESRDENFFFKYIDFITPFSGNSTNGLPFNISERKSYFALKGQLQFPDSASAIMIIKGRGINNIYGQELESFEFAINI